MAAPPNSLSQVALAVAPPPTQQAAVEAAVAQLLAALPAAPAATQRHLARTPARVATLWLDHLLAGQRIDVAQLLAGAMPHASATPVVLRRLAIHLVCPHHLTVAWGVAHVAYLPGGKIVGAARLGDLVQALTARLVLQEEATQQICDALVEHLQARCAVAQLEAVHPCHTATRPQGHAARLLTLAQAGRRRPAAGLLRLLRPAGARRR